MDAGSYPWYDAKWLRKYVAAKALIAERRPEKLSAFTQALDRLRTRPDFSVRKLDRVFDVSVMRLLRETIKASAAKILERHEAGRFGRDVVHDHPVVTHLQKTLVPLVGELAGETVEPSYNFLSLYSDCGVCEPHMDAPNAKWTLDLCIEQSDIWPIYFSQIVPWPEDFSYRGEDWQTYIKQSPALRFSSFDLRPNEAVLFSGSSQWHYRDRMISEQGRGF